MLFARAQKLYSPENATSGEISSRIRHGSPLKLQRGALYVSGRRASSNRRSIHNLFFVASAWRMIWTILVHIAEHIREDVPIRQQLGENEQLREYFLILYDCINDISEASHQQVSQLIIASRRSLIMHSRH